MFRTGKHVHAARAVHASSLRRPGSRDEDAGFTLIEAIVSFTIFAIVTAAAVSAIVTGIKTSNNNRDRVTAAGVAQQALAEVQAAPVSSLSALPALATASLGNRSYTVTRRVTVETSPSASTPATACPSAIAPGTAYWLHVSVQVKWNGGPSAGLVMNTVRSC